MWEWWMDVMDALMRQIDEDIYKIETWFKKLFRRSK